MYTSNYQIIYYLQSPNDENSPSTAPPTSTHSVISNSTLTSDEISVLRRENFQLKIENELIKNENEELNDYVKKLKEENMNLVLEVRRLNKL